jgi:uncharacterized protein (DUF697 family)
MPADLSPGPEPVRPEPVGEAPVVWMLGPAGSGQTSLLAELTHGWRSALRHALEPVTPTAEMLPFPAEAPRLRFLLTTGLVPDVPYDASADLAVMETQPGLILVTLAAADTALAPLASLLRQLHAAHPAWPILVAQTRLHALYEAGAQHPMPYAFDAEGAPGPLVPARLADALRAQRVALAGLGLRFVPLDLTEPEQGQAVLDYGAEALREAIALAAPAVAARLKSDQDPETHIHRQVVLPWALAAAASEAAPLPVFGGIPALAFQVAMVRAIARRYAVGADGTVWATLLTVLGGGFLLRYGLGWMLRQGLKLAPIWGAAAAAAWSFAVTCGIGEAAIRLCREEAAGRQATPEALREAFRLGHREGAAVHGAGRGSASF